jgi:hypothetical protein
MTITHEDLNSLRDTQFEKLIKALLLSVIGNGVIPFSQGKDGAREAKFVGKAKYPSEKENWDGSWIFQVKYSDTSNGIKQARSTIRNSIANELNKLVDYGYIKDNKCDNYIYITNVPFSGESNRGMHDYIAEQAKLFKIKHFDYWDGEKVMAFLNKYPSVRESFFPTPGFEQIDSGKLDDLTRIFVKPAFYENLKHDLKNNRIITIIGQPHVGKTFLSTYLALDLKADLDLNNIFLVTQIEKLASQPKVNNCVIIFDDLYGDLAFEGIGNNTKVLSSIKAGNFVIITSRNYIFEEAELKEQVLPEMTHAITINQEGTYSDSELMDMLVKHLEEYFPLNNWNKRARQFILQNSSKIIQKIRFPHNIHLFTTILENNTTTIVNLNKKITESKEIELIIQSWLKIQSQENKNILLVLAIGKIQYQKLLNDICEIQWGYSSDQIDNCLRKNTRIVFYDNSIVRFIHPSYKDATLGYMMLASPNIFSNLIINLITNSRFLEKRLVNRSITYKVIEEIDSQQLEKLIANKYLGKNYVEVIWLTLIRRSIKEAIEYFFSLKLERKNIKSKYIASFLASKSFMKDREIQDIINVLFDYRHRSKIVDELIFHFSFGIRNKIRPIISRLDTENSVLDQILRIKLLGAIGSKYPEQVINELSDETMGKSALIRESAYISLNVLSREAGPQIRAIFEKSILIEKNKTNIHRIKRSLKSLNF